MTSRRNEVVADDINESCCEGAKFSNTHPCKKLRAKLSKIYNVSLSHKTETTSLRVPRRLLKFNFNKHLNFETYFQKLESEHSFFFTPISLLIQLTIRHIS